MTVRTLPAGPESNTQKGYAGHRLPSPFMVKLFYGDEDEVTPVTDNATVTMSVVGGSAKGEVSLLPGGTDRAASKQVTVDGSTIEGYMWLADDVTGQVEFKIRGVKDLGGNTVHSEETIVADSDTTPSFESLQHVQEGRT